MSMKKIADDILSLHEKKRKKKNNLETFMEERWGERENFCHFKKSNFIHIAF